MAHFIIWNPLSLIENTKKHNINNYHYHRYLGGHQIADWLSSFGYKVEVIDFCSMLSTDQLVNITKNFITKETKAIGVSCTFWGHASYEPIWVLEARERLNHYNLDWIIGGNMNHHKNAFKYDWNIIQSFAEEKILSYLSEGKTIKTFDITTFDSYFTSGIGVTAGDVLPIELSRGCQFRCKFCHYPLIGKKKGTYIKGMECVEKIFRENYDRNGVTRYLIVDDTFNESEEKIIGLAKIAQRLPFRLEWVGYNRLDLIGNKPHTAALLKESGLRSTFFGIESFGLKGSHLVGKGWNGKHAKDFLIKLKQEWGTDVTFAIGFIVGLIGDTPKDMFETQRWCVENQMDSWHYSTLTMAKNNDFVFKSEFDINAEKYGYEFPNEKDPFFWKHGIWNTHYAGALAEDLNDESYSIYAKFAGLGSATVASAGYSFDEILNTKWNDFDVENYTKRVNALIENYYNSQMNRRF